MPTRKRAAGLCAATLLTFGSVAAPTAASSELPLKSEEAASSTTAERTATEAPSHRRDRRTDNEEICEFAQRVDSAHISHSGGPRAVQSHGSWGNKNCAYPFATVTTGVMKRNVVGIYVDVGRLGQAVLPPGDGGRGNRVTARYECNGTGRHWFQSWTDVDVHGITDLPNKVFSTPEPLGCN